MTDKVVDVGPAAWHAGRDRAGRNLQEGAPLGGRLHSAGGHRQSSQRDPLQAPGSEPAALPARFGNAFRPSRRAIKPHPYGVELGALIKMLKETTCAPAVASRCSAIFRE